MKIAYTTLVGTDSYIMGALCLAESYHRLNLSHDFIFLVNENISNQGKDLIINSGLGIYKEIPNIEYVCKSDNDRFCSTTGKFEIFNLIEYDKVIFLDADTLLLQPIDEITKYDY